MERFLPFSFWLSLLGACALLASSSQGQEPYWPVPTIEHMAMGADVVVAGTHLGNGEVRISKVFYDDTMKLKEGETHSIPAVATHHRKRFDHEKFNVWKPLDPEAYPEITTHELVLFLKLDSRNQLEIVYRDGWGSRGLVWYDEEQCFGYAQVCEPEPYQLVEGTSQNFEQPLVGQQDLWRRIESVGEQREMWADIKAIEIPERRLEAMAAYYPKAEEAGGQLWIFQMSNEFTEIGPPAIPTLTELFCKAESEVNACRVARILARCIIQVHARQRAEVMSELTPEVRRWLETTETNNVHDVLHLLELAGDPKQAEFMRTYLKHEDVNVVCMAIRTLGNWGDQQSFEPLAKMLADSEDEGVSYYERCLAQAMMKLDPNRAGPLIIAFAQQEGNGKLLSHLREFFNQ